MVYISSSGTIENSTPWSLSRLVAFFWSILNFIYMFFKTLLNPYFNKHGDRYTRDYRPGPSPPRPPTRRMGGFGSGSFTCNAPPGGGG